MVGANLSRIDRRRARFSTSWSGLGGGLVVVKISRTTLHPQRVHFLDFFTYPRHTERSIARIEASTRKYSRNEHRL